MKVAITRGPGRFGGIFRRFCELCEYCRGRHEVFGLMPLAANDDPEYDPVRTFAYARTRIRPTIMQADSIASIVESCDPLVEAIAQDLKRERPDKVLASDTDLKALSVVEAAHRAGFEVTTHVAGLSSREAEHEGSPLRTCMSYVERYCLERSNRLIFPSQFAADECAARFPHMAPYTVIHNGIAGAFLNAPKPRPDSRRIGAVMRLAGIKNPEMLAAVAERLRDLGFSVELITGRVSRAMMARLSAVRLLPQTNCTEDLATFFGSCCSVLSPSHFEVSGNVPLEAVACGTPAVITDRMGICEIFRSVGLQALIISVGDLEGAVDRLTDAAPISETVRDYLRANYRWPDVCSRIIAVA